MDFAEGASEAQAAEQTEVTHGPIYTLFASALTCTEARRDVVQDTSESAFLFALALAAAAVAPELLLWGLFFLRLGGMRGLVFFATRIAMPVLLAAFLVCLLLGGLLSLINCKIAGCEHSWMEYQVFMSAMVWIAPLRVARLIGLFARMPTLVYVGIAFASMVAASVCISLNYSEALKDRPERKTPHQIYAAVAFLILLTPYRVFELALYFLARPHIGLPRS